MPKIISDEKTTKTLIELEKYIDQLELDHFLDYRNLFSKNPPSMPHILLPHIIIY